MPLITGYVDAAPILEYINQPEYQRCMVLTANTFFMQYRLGDYPPNYMGAKTCVFVWDGTLGGFPVGGRFEVRVMNPAPSSDVRSDVYFMNAIDTFLRSAYANIRQLARLKTGQQW